MIESLYETNRTPIEQFSDYWGECVDYRCSWQKKLEVAVGLLRLARFRVVGYDFKGFLECRKLWLCVILPEFLKAGCDLPGDVVQGYVFLCSAFDRLTAQMQSFRGCRFFEGRVPEDI